MCLEEFTNKVEKALIRYYGEEAEVKSQKVQKNNGVLLYGICVMKKGKNIAPTIYLNEFYEQYKEGITFGEVIKEIIQIMEHFQVNHNIDIEFFTDYNKVKPALVLRLIHFEENRELLENVPHRRFMDLAVVCHCVIENKEIGSGAILIRKEHMESWNVDEDAMFDDAYRNSPIKEPCKFIKMSDLLKELLADTIIRRAHSLCKDGEDEQELIQELTERMETDIDERHFPMYVLTNQKRYFGASCILYPKVLEKIGNILREDYYIIPSSIHEVLVIRESESMDSADINRIIREVNQTQVEQVEWLSNHTYFYDRNRKKLFAVTNS